MRKKIIQVLIILAGIALLAYPWISNYLNDKAAQSAINVYQDKVKETDKKELEKMLEEAREYNKKLVSSNVVLSDPFAAGENSGISEKDYLHLLSLDNTGVMCSVEIPAIDVNLPVYHGTSTEVLEKGVGHLEGTSLPVGGKSTHAVLTGHTGLNKAKLFTDLTELKKGDQFYIRVLDKILAYQIDAIHVVLPQDTKRLNIVEGKDYVTLVTCTPYGQNTHRLLVRGKRTKYSQKEYEKERSKKNTGQSQWKSSYKKAIVIGSVAVILLLFIISLIKRRNEKKRRRRRPEFLW